MNILSFAKKILQRFTFLHRIRFTQITTLVYGTVVIIVLAITVIGWNTYLFIQSISPLESVAVKESKKISLTSEDISEAIRIIDQRQQQFDALLKEKIATTTIPF